MELFNDFFFDAAHLLPNLPEGHKCRRLHGHTYRVRIYVSGEVNINLGWVNDFGDITRTAWPVIEELDHRFLNDIEGLNNPTCENIACWIWERLNPVLRNLSKVEIMETPATGCAYSGEK